MNQDNISTQIIQDNQITHGPCNYCSLTMCTTCIELNAYCHTHEQGRTTCSIHAKQYHLLKINSNRVVATPKQFNTKKLLLTNHVEFPITNYKKLFSGFYNEFGVCFKPNLFINI